jgi:hypothetical protein
MGELSDRFAELMARLAKSDADLFRAIGAQNASLRHLVDDIAPVASAASTASLSPASPAAVLPPAGLLPPEACDLKALKARFGKLVDAQAWLEGQIGPAPKKPTWAVIAQTCRGGAWPAGPGRRASAASNSLTTLALEERLAALEQRLEHQLERRFNRLEALLKALAQALDHRQADGGGPASDPHPFPAHGSPPVN